MAAFSTSWSILVKLASLYSLVRVACDMFSSVSLYNKSRYYKTKIFSKESDDNYSGQTSFFLSEIKLVEDVLSVRALARQMAI